MSPDFTIKECQPGDKEQVRELYAACYGRDSDRYPSPAEWNWRYHNGLYKSTIWLAKWGNQVAAQRAAVVKTVKIGQEYHPAAHFMDVMTHPDYRRRGLFTRLVRRTTAAVTEQGAAIGYSFPNESSFPGFVAKTDWPHVGSLSLFMKPVNAEALLGERVGNPALRNGLAFLLRPGLALACRESRHGRAAGVSVRRLVSFDQRFDAFWEQVANDYEVILRRDSRHLNWRYVQRPSVEYAVYAAEEGDRIAGFIVVRTRRMFGMNLGLIVELLTLNRDQRVAQALVAQSARHLVGVGADAITCVMFDHQPYSQALRREGFLRVPEKLLPRRFYFVARANQDDPNLRKVLDRRNWFLTWGDNDAI